MGDRLRAMMRLTMWMPLVAMNLTMVLMVMVMSYGDGCDRWRGWCPTNRARVATMMVHLVSHKHMMCRQPMNNTTNKADVQG
eukprot:2319583-Lingulodinium_polyedra.AAC.1